MLEIRLHFPHNASLKGKRRELRPLKAALQRRFGAAVAETEHHDLWQRATLSAAVVGREAGEVAEAAAAIERFVHAQFPDGAQVQAQVRSSEDFV
ncbi:MAG: DUF503 domain-containing protein [Thermoleophilaceae bacterium]|jgi:uncharacterized protein YlxP (DUF503 family)